MKHKKLTMIVALVLVVALAAGLGIWATGETNVPTVTYYDGSDGNGARFTFTHTAVGHEPVPELLQLHARRQPHADHPRAG